MTNTQTPGTGNFMPTSVRVVDYNSENNNILVRGSAAFGATNASTGAAFAIGDLISAIIADPNFSATGIRLPMNPSANPPFIIDICLVGFGSGDLTDQSIVQNELAWFAASPPVIEGTTPPSPAYPVIINSTVTDHPGIMVYWPILSIGPPLTSTQSWPTPAENASISQSIDSGYYNYEGLIPAIRYALFNDPNQSTPFSNAIKLLSNAIIYVHCDSGVNRTGAAITGYLMQYGTNVTAMQPAASLNLTVPYTLSVAQQMAYSAPPTGNVPPGGADIAVTQAFCQLKNSGSISGTLDANCVPYTYPTS